MKFKNVGYLLVEYRDKLPREVGEQAEHIAAISKWLRKEREFAFYGDVDFIPSLEYTSEDAQKAYGDLEIVIKAAEKVIVGA